MLLATYQPYAADESFHNARYDCFREKLGGAYPVFCIPARTADEFCFRSLLIVPEAAEVCLLVDVDDAVRFDTVEWRRIERMDRDSEEFKEAFEAMFDLEDERFAEYVIPAGELSRNVVAKTDVAGYLSPDAFDNVEGEVKEILLAQQRRARRYFDDGYDPAADMRCGEKAGKWYVSSTNLDAYLWFGAFTEYRIMERFRNGKESISPTDILSLYPSGNMPDRDALWDRFDAYRSEAAMPVLDGDGHKVFLEAARAYEDLVGGGRVHLYSRYIGRNDPCICGSGRKYKACCLRRPTDVFPSDS